LRKIIFSDEEGRRQYLKVAVEATVQEGLKVVGPALGSNLAVRASQQNGSDGVETAKSAGSN
jgi:hypothetical protein